MLLNLFKMKQCALLTTNHRIIKPSSKPLFFSSTNNTIFKILFILGEIHTTLITLYRSHFQNVRHRIHRYHPIRERVLVRLWKSVHISCFLTHCLDDRLRLLLSIYNNTSPWLGEYSTTILLSKNIFYYYILKHTAQGIPTN